VNRARRLRKSYPKGVVGVYDNGGKSADRYTVVFAPFVSPHDGNLYWQYLAMSSAPFHPQGVGLSGETCGHRPGVGAGSGWGNACGRVIEFEELPADCQKAARDFMAAE